MDSNPEPMHLRDYRSPVPPPGRMKMWFFRTLAELRAWENQHQDPEAIFRTHSRNCPELSYAFVGSLPDGVPYQPLTPGLPDFVQHVGWCARPGPAPGRAPARIATAGASGRFTPAATRPTRTTSAQAAGVTGASRPGEGELAYIVPVTKVISGPGRPFASRVPSRFDVSGTLVNASGGLFGSRCLWPCRPFYRPGRKTRPVAAGGRPLAQKSPVVECA